MHKKWRILLAILLILCLAIGMIPADTAVAVDNTLNETSANAENIIFPDNSEIHYDEDDELNASTEVLPENSVSDTYEEEEELGGSGEIEIPDNADSVWYDEDELGMGTEVFPDDSSSKQMEDDSLDAAQPEFQPDNDELDESEIIPSGDISDDYAEENNGIDEDELGAASVILSASSTSISVQKGYTAFVNLTYRNYNKNVYMQYGLGNGSICSCKWGGWSQGTIPLTITGKNAGSTYVYIYLKDASSNVTLRSLSLRVTVTTPKLTASSSSVSLKAGSAANVKFTYSGCSGSVYLQYGTTNSNAYSCKWGNWSGSTIPLTITGKSVGTGTVNVYLKSAATNQTLAQVSIRISVTAAASPKVIASASSLTIKSNGSTTLTFTCSNYSGAYYLQYGTTNSNAYSCSWGSWSGNKMTMTIRGKNAGSGIIYVYMKAASTKATLASTSVRIYVNAAETAKVTPSSSRVTLQSGNSAKVNFTVSGVFGSYYLQYGTTNSNAYRCSWGSWSGSTIPLTITGKNAGSGTVIVYLKNKSTNATLAQTFITITVTSAAKPSVSVSPSSVSVKSGMSTVVTASYANVSDKIYLKYGITNSSAYSCSWGNWSGSTIPLTITGKSVGSGKVYVYLMRASDNAQLAYITISVNVTAGSTSLSNLSYKFSNFSEAATLAICQYMYGNTQLATSVYNQRLGAGGNCFGMASTAGMFHVSNDVNVSAFNSTKTLISQLEMTNRNRTWNLNVKQFVQAMQITQVSSTLNRNFSSLDTIVSQVSSQTKQGLPVLISIYGEYNGSSAGHAVLAYGVEQLSSTQVRLLIYDNNYPLTTRYLTLTRPSSNKSYNTWSYPLTNSVTWGSGRNYGRIAYTVYSNYYNLWKKRGSLTNGSLNLLSSNSVDFSIYNVYGELIAKVTDGQLDTDNESIIEVPYSEVDLTGQSENHNYLLYLPVDLYVVKNDNQDMKEFDIGLVNVNLAANVITEADEVTICADDSCKLNSVLMQTEEGEKYQITLSSSMKGEPANYELTGEGTGEVLSASCMNGDLSLCNMEDVDLSMGDVNTGKTEEPERDKYTITSKAGAHGSVTPSGTETVEEDTDITYTIQADTGYVIQDVQIDGKSVGIVKSYTFKNVAGNHTIAASFIRKGIVKTVSLKTTKYTYDGSAKKPAVVVKDELGKTLNAKTDYTVSYSKNQKPGTAVVTVVGKGDYSGTVSKTFTISKAKQKITSIASCTKTYRAAAFKLKAKTVKGGGKLKYTSNNSSVAKVDSAGKVTLQKGYGKAVITITAVENSLYQKAAKKVTITVVPKAVSKISVKSGSKKGTIQVSWTKDKTVTGYQIRYAAKSNMSGAKTVKVKASSANKTIGKLEKGKKYYIQVRAYKTVNKTSYYGSYSSKKAVTVKK